MIKTLGFPGTRFGDQTIDNGNLVIATSGKGIDFSATPGTGTSELFNDYEEGTFTPVVRDDPTGNAATATTQGRYTKIGRMVFFTISLVNINTTGLTGANGIHITGLPFTAANIANHTCPAQVYGSGVTSTAGNLVASVQQNTTYLNIRNGTTSGESLATVSQIGSGFGDLYISGLYQAA